MLDWLFIPLPKLLRHSKLREIWGNELPHVIQEAFGINRWEAMNLSSQNFPQKNFIGMKQWWGRIRLIRASLLYRSKVPYEYIWGHALFQGRDFRLNRSVLIPRPETEEWVGQVIKDINSLKTSEEIRILDIGTGSGVIAITLKAEFPVSHVTAVEISTPALKIARKNANRLLKTADEKKNVQPKLGTPPIRFLQGDIFQLPFSELLADNKPFDLVVTNPPYVGKKEEHSLPPEVVRHEPHLALFAQEDGLGFYRKLAKIIPTLLKPGGYLYTEIGWQQGEAVGKLFAFLQEKSIVKDMFGKDRLFMGRVGQ